MKALALLALACVVIASSAATARHRHQINAVPFAHTPCSVLANEPCTPSFCSVFGPNPCIPELPFPFSEDLRLTIESHPRERAKNTSDNPKSDQNQDHDHLNTISDLFGALRLCWHPPQFADATANMQMSIRFALKRTGEMIAPPRVTFARHDVSDAARATYLDSITSSLNQCLPLPLTPGLGGAIAGKPIAIRYVENRDLSGRRD